MISILLAMACTLYEPSGGQCLQWRIEQAQTWQGPTAPMDCDAELISSRHRLAREGLEHHLKLWCETESAAE
jgi:hypothetical protein